MVALKQSEGTLMDVQAEVDREWEAVQRICTVARCRSCPAFLDLLWGDPDPFIRLENSGVMFESPHRVVVFQEISGELRYYAGGWCLDKNRIYLEQDRMYAEGSEIGVFQTVADALTFSEQYLVEERQFQAIPVQRQVYYERWPDLE